MAELDELHKLNDRLRLVPKGDSDAERDKNCGLFTRAAAWELRSQGWGNIRKTEGHQIDGLDVDKILRRPDGLAADIIVRASAPDAHVAWQPFNGQDILKRWVAPRDPFNGEEPPPPPVDDIVEVLSDIDHTLESINATLNAQVQELQRIVALLERVAERLGQ